ncbi:MAG: transketolase [Gammaproteobacteria bacterium]|jgi:transketolase
MSVDDLTKEAKVAYQVFQDMGVSKEAYFHFLQDIDIKYKQGGAASIAENLQLEKLLGVHDKNVIAFNTAMSAVEGVEARNALIKVMS